MVLSLLVARQCSKLSSYAISKKSNEPKNDKMTKNLVLDPILDNLVQIWAPQLFLRVLPLFTVRIVPSYHPM